MVDVVGKKYLHLSVKNIIILFNTWASKGFDRDLEAGEASRMVMRKMAKLKLNANENLAYAA